MILKHLTMLMDSDHTGGGQDLITWVNVEPLCCVFETNVRLYIHDTSIKKKYQGGSRCSQYIGIKILLK